MRKRMLQLKALPAVGISVFLKPILRSSASTGDPTRVVSSSSRAGAAPSSLRPRRPSRSSAPPPPSAPVLGFPLRATDCAKQPADGVLHLFPNHVADHSDQTPSSRHGTSFTPPSRSRQCENGSGGAIGECQPQPVEGNRRARQVRLSQRGL